MARSFSLMTAVEEMEIDDEETGAGSDAIEVPGEVRDAEDEVEGREEVIDEAGDDIDTLEDIKDILDEAADKGEGIDETAAKIVEVTTEAIYARLGFTGAQTLGSMESFKNARSRVTATKMAAEGIRDRIGRAWDAIVKFFKDLRAKVKELWVKYVTQVGRLKRAAEAMRRKVASTSGTKKNDTFKDKSMASKILGKDNKVNIEKAIDNTIKELDKFSAMKDKVGELVEKYATDKDLDEKSKDFLKSYADATRKNAGVGSKAEYDETKVMIGNKRIAFYVDESEEKVTFDILEVTVDNGVEDEEIDVESKPELEKHCSSVVKLCQTVLAAKERKEKADAKVEKALEKISKEVSEKDKSDEGKKLAKDTRMVRELLRAASKMSYLPEKIAVSGCHTALAYVGKCLREYEK
jgi:hypothetical protein